MKVTSTVTEVSKAALNSSNVVDLSMPWMLRRSSEEQANFPKRQEKRLAVYWSIMPICLKKITFGGSMGGGRHLPFVLELS